eukprot:1158424-Pelagomonas_calceolata.AAC.4
MSAPVCTYGCFQVSMNACVCTYGCFLVPLDVCAQYVTLPDVASRVPSEDCHNLSRWVGDISGVYLGMGKAVGELSVTMDMRYNPFSATKECCEDVNTSEA